MLDYNESMRNTLQKTRDMDMYHMKQKKNDDGGIKAMICNPLVIRPFASLLYF